ncbi:MAG: choice-of-anchor Q domain-containing protein [Thermomicrobiales bacterium]
MRRVSLVALVLGFVLPMLTVSVVRAATVTVTTTADMIHNPGCATDGVTSPCSLRDATIFANAHSGSTITLPAGIYTLTIPPDTNDDATTGDLNLSGSVTINGAGAATTIIQASATNSSTGIDGVFLIGSFGPVTTNVMLNDVAIRNGNRPGNQHAGGGIAVVGYAVITLNNCVVSGNTAIGGSGGGIDLGIAGGQLTLNDSMVSNNFANIGGGISMSGGKLIAIGSTISGNTAASSGGGIDKQVGDLTLTNSTVSGNILPGAGSGGGIDSSIGSLTITNSTISGNMTNGGWGGALANFTGSATISNSTIAGNSTGFFFGGAGGPPIIRDSVLANSTANCTVQSPYNTYTSGDYNLSSDASCTSLTQPHDMNNVNPLIGPLAYNGGPTPTHALLSGSPAIDRVPITGSYCPTTDQRGVARPQGPLCDIGAYEVVLAAAPPPRPGPSPDPNMPSPVVPPPRPNPPTVTSTAIPLPPHR